MEAEIIIVGGASVVLNYGFRQGTIDVDVYIKSSSAMKDAIRIIRDRYDLSNDWMNDDFKYTSSFTPDIALYAKKYKTFSNIVHVYTISGSYLIAMKMMSSRPYANDKSDIIGIISEHHIRGEDISLDDIKNAAEKLYGSYENIPIAFREYVEDIFTHPDISSLYSTQLEEERINREMLSSLKDTSILNQDNVNEILMSMRDNNQDV